MDNNKEIQLLKGIFNTKTITVTFKNKDAIAMPARKLSPDERTNAENAGKFGRYNIATRMRYKTIIDKDYSKRDFVKPGFPLGMVGSLISSGGSGKTYKMLQDGILIAATEEYGKRGGVLYLPAEDSMEEIGPRLQAITEAYGLTDEEKEIADQNFQIWSLLGESPDLLEEPEKDVRPLADAICAIAQTYDRDPLRLIIFDTLRRFSYADENNGGQMSQILSIFELICKRVNCSCMFLHHSTKNAAMNNNLESQQAARGSSVLVDNVRYQEFMAVMGEEEAERLGEVVDGKPPKTCIGPDRKLYVKWGVSKQNYGAIIPSQWYKRNESGVLLKVTVAHFDKSATTSRNNRNEY